MRSRAPFVDGPPEDLLAVTEPDLSGFGLRELRRVARVTVVVTWCVLRSVLRGVRTRRRIADAAADGVDMEVRQLVRGNEPAEDLISVADETGADLIVIGLRRRTPVGKLILGSNAQRILLDAPCAVLAVKA